MTALRARRLLFAALFIIVTYLTLTPNPDDTEGGLSITRWIAELLFGSGVFGDKVAHFGAYGVLAISAGLAQLSLFGRRSFVIIALAIWGVVLEGLQGLGGVRVADAGDALANAGGALAGAVFVAAAQRIRFSRPA